MQAAFSAKAICSRATAADLIILFAVARAVRLGPVGAVSRYSFLNPIYQTNQGLRSRSLRSAFRCAFLSARPAPSSSGQQMRG